MLTLEEFIEYYGKVIETICDDKEVLFWVLPVFISDVDELYYDIESLVSKVLGAKRDLKIEIVDKGKPTSIVKITVDELTLDIIELKREDDYTWTISSLDNLWRFLNNNIKSRGKKIYYSISEVAFFFMVDEKKVNNSLLKEFKLLFSFDDNYNRLCNSSYSYGMPLFLNVSLEEKLDSFFNESFISDAIFSWGRDLGIQNRIQNNRVRCLKTHSGYNFSIDNHDGIIQIIKKDEKNFLLKNNLIGCLFLAELSKRVGISLKNASLESISKEVRKTIEYINSF